MTHRSHFSPHALLAALLLTVPLAFAGCASSGNELDRAKLDQVEKGVTTRAEFERLLGPPNGVGMAGSGDRLLHYHFMEAKAKGVSFIPVVGPWVGGADTRTQNLQVRVDSEGIVQDYEFTEQTGETSNSPFSNSRSQTTASSTGGATGE